MPDVATNLLLSVAVFAGAFVSSLAGFAFSAVAGAILLRIFQPMEAVPLMMACSIGVQAANLWALRRNIQWEGSLLLIIGGALGIPIAIYLLQNADTHVLRIAFGIIVALYAGYMLFRPTLMWSGGATSRRLTALIGFGGGLVGGLTAMPGAVPTIWCDMRGMPKNDQRGLVQPFIAIMQVLALALLLGRQACRPGSWSTSPSACRRCLPVPRSALLHSGTSTRSGFAGSFLCYCCCQALRSHWLDFRDRPKAAKSQRIPQHWPKES